MQQAGTTQIQATVVTYSKYTTNTDRIPSYSLNRLLHCSGSDQEIKEANNRKQSVITTPRGVLRRVPLFGSTAGMLSLTASRIDSCETRGYVTLFQNVLISTQMLSLWMWKIHVRLLCDLFK